MVGDLFFLAALSWVATGIGAALLQRVRAKPVRPDDAMAQALPLGLGLIALTVLGLGQIGLLDRTILIALLGTVALLTSKAAARLVARASGLQLARFLRILMCGTAPDRALLGLTTVTLLGAGLTASLPVTDGDALCYHLQVPKLFLIEKSIFFAPDQHETVYPMLVELLNALALDFRGPIACRWIQFLLGVVFAANVTFIARPILGTRAWWAGSIALMVPAISNGMSAPLNDVALAAFGVAAIAAVMRAIDHQQSRFAAIAGLFMGLALGVKYPALVLLAILSSLLFADIVVRRSRGEFSRVRESVPRLLAFFGLTILIGGVWYLRAFVYTGNPVFPYFKHIFAGSGLDEVMDPSRRSMPVSAWNILTAIVPMTLAPDRFESFAHQFGPIFLLFLPALLFERPPRRLWRILAIGYAFLMICVSQRQSTRFVLTALGPLSVGVAYMALVWSRRGSAHSRLLLSFLLLALSFQTVQAAARCRSGYRVLLGWESTEEYLTRREPTFRVGKWIDTHLAASARIIGQDHRGFYIPRPYSMELAHRRRTGLGNHGESPDSIIRHFRDQGFTHLMLCPPIPDGAVEFDPTLGQLLEPWLAKREPIYEAELSDGDGIVRRYAIHPLEPAQSQPETWISASAGLREPQKERP